MPIKFIATSDRELTRRKEEQEEEIREEEIKARRVFEIHPLWTG